MIIMTLRRVSSMGSSAHTTTSTLSGLQLTHLLLIVPILVSIMTQNVRAACHGEPDFDYMIGCDTQYLDCESCVATTLMNRCHGWCSPSGTCGGTCLESDQVYEEWCPLNTDNPPFGSQDCIALSFELYYCNQAVTNVGCDENYASNYCELDDQQTGVPLCNGDSIVVMNMRYLPELGGASVGRFVKNPNGVRVEFGWLDYRCYKFHYEPIQDTFACQKDDSFALKYTLALDGGATSPSPSPTTPMPVASTIRSPSPTPVPVSMATTGPTAIPGPVASPNDPSASPMSVASPTTPTSLSVSTRSPAFTSPPAAAAYFAARWWLVAGLGVALILIEFA